MRIVKLVIAAATVVVLGYSSAYAQSSGAAGGGSNGTNIAYDTPRLAALPSVKNLVQELQNAGFTNIEVHRTFLGRARFVAYKGHNSREVVINPTTGEVLRDLVTVDAVAAQANANAQNAGNNGNANGNGNSGNSGNGNGNSGNSGNGNSNSGNSGKGNSGN